MALVWKNPNIYVGDIKIQRPKTYVQFNSKISQKVRKQFCFYLSYQISSLSLNVFLWFIVYLFMGVIKLFKAVFNEFCNISCCARMFGICYCTGAVV